MSLRATASQTVGPYFSIGLSPLYCSHLGSPAAVSPGASHGERLEVRGRVLDGDGLPVGDAVLELWLADAEGRYPHPEDPRAAHVATDFRGFGRVATDVQGAFAFSLVLPGNVPGPRGTAQAPHVSVQVLARGLLKPLLTRMYFPDGLSDAQAKQSDPVLALVPADRRATLIATVAGPQRLSWDVHLQGELETVCFEY